MASSSSSLTVGQRVRILGKEGGGTIRFVGTTDFKDGTWVGVEMDLHEGRHDGTVEGKSYFTCPAGRGVMVPPEKVLFFFSIRDESIALTAAAFTTLSLSS